MKIEDQQEPEMFYCVQNFMFNKFPLLRYAKYLLSPKLFYITII